MSPQLDVDDEVRLTIRNNRRAGESDNEVLRRLLKLSGTATTAVIGRNAGPSRPKTIAELVEVGALLRGDELTWRNNTHGTLQAQIGADGTFDVVGVGTFEAPSAPLRKFTGSEMNGWINWRLERTGETLHAVRQRVQLERERLAQVGSDATSDDTYAYATVAPLLDSATLAALRTFVAERDWDQFHSPENLAKSISIEAAELLELYQWGQTPDQTRVEEELADVLTYCIHLANRIGVDIDEIVLSKLEKTRLKYPVELSKGSVTKRVMPKTAEP